MSPPPQSSSKCFQMAAFPHGSSCLLVTSLVWFPNLTEAGVPFGVPKGVPLTCHKIFIIGLENKSDSGIGVPKSRTATTCGNNKILLYFLQRYLYTVSKPAMICGVPSKVLFAVICKITSKSYCLVCNHT